MRRILFVAALVAALAGCGGSGGRTPVVVDTDLSTDDVVAILYLAQRDDVDLRAVTVSGTGFAHCPPGAQHVLDLLAAAGRRDVPVACGPADPLAGYNQFPADWRNFGDAFFALPLPRSGLAADRRGAVALLASAVESAPRKTTVLSLAPLTDTALLLRSSDAKRRIARIVAMGGAVGVPGNIGPGHEHAEYNVWVDPTAAQEVVASGVPVTLVPLDATNDLPVTTLFADALQPRHYSTAAAALVWELFVRTQMYDGRQYFWDPLAAAAIAEPGPLRFAEKRLRVEPATGRVVETPAGSPIRVVVAADRPAFETNLLRTLVGGTVPTPKQRVGGGLAFDGRRATMSGAGTVSAGQGPADVVNTSDREITVTVGTLRERRSASDLRRLVRGLRGKFQPPAWFSADTSGTVPPHVATVWYPTLAPGPKAIVITSAGRPGATVVGGITAVGAQ